MRGGNSACPQRTLLDQLTTAQRDLIKAQKRLQTYYDRSVNARQMAPFGDVTDTLEFVTAANQDVEQAVECVSRDTGESIASEELEALRSCANYVPKLNGAIANIERMVTTNDQESRQALAELALDPIGELLACRQKQAAIERFHTRRGRGTRRMPRGGPRGDYGGRHLIQFEPSKSKPWWKFW